MNNFVIPFKYFFDEIVDRIGDNEFIGFEDMNKNTLKLKGKNGYCKVKITIVENTLLITFDKSCKNKKLEYNLNYYFLNLYKSYNIDNMFDEIIDDILKNLN